MNKLYLPNFVIAIVVNIAILFHVPQLVYFTIFTMIHFVFMAICSDYPPNKTCSIPVVACFMFLPKARNVLETVEDFLLNA